MGIIGSALLLASMLAQQHTLPRCDLGGAPILRAAPELKQLQGARALFGAARAQKGPERTDVDERVTPLTIGVQADGMNATLPLALPRGARGDLVLSFTAHACLEAQLVHDANDVSRLEWVWPIQAKLTFKRGAAPAVERNIKLERITLHATHVVLVSTTGEEQSVYLGKKLPDAALLHERGGARAYLSSLAALDGALTDDINADASPAAQAIVFLAQAERLRHEIASLPPARRLELAQKIRPSGLPATLGPLARYWQQQLSANPQTARGSARLLVGDDVEQVFIDGVSVFERNSGASSSVEIGAPELAVRVWIVPRGDAVQVFDTNAVVKSGQIYDVGAQRFGGVSGGARWECIRVRGTLPGHSGGGPFRWRELGTPPGPLMQHDEAFRPSGAQDRREVGVTAMDMSAARVPALPLVYSYTHPGSYEWTIRPDGSAQLRLLTDEKLCGENTGNATP
jgi:hypothetical protein